MATLTDDQVRDLEPKVRALVRTQFSGVPASLADADDLAQYGLMAALRAAERYDPTRGTALKTWCYTAAHRGILDALRALQPGARRGSYVAPLSLDEQQIDDGGPSLHDQVPDDFVFADPFDGAIYEKLLRAVSSRTEGMLRMRFEADMTQAEIADLYEVTESRVNQLINQALRALADHPALAA